MRPTGQSSHRWRKYRSIVHTPAVSSPMCPCSWMLEPLSASTITGRATEADLRRRYRLLFCFIGRLERPKVYAVRAIALCARLLRRTSKDLFAPGNLKVDESRSHDRGF